MGIKLATFDEVLKNSAAVYGPGVAYSRFNVSTGSWETVTFAELEARVRDLAPKLALAGIRAGDKVAILGEASIEWVETFYALMLINAVVVPLDIKLSEGELSNIINHSDARFIFASEQFVDMARRLRHTSVESFKLYTLGKPWGKALGSVELQEDRDALAVICYTSGTLGAPKGVMISKEALLTQMEFLAENEKNHNQVIFSILPLNHIYGLTAGPLATLRRGYELCFPHQLLPDELKKCLRDRKVTQFFTVPLYLRMVMNEIFNKVRAAGKLKSTIFSALLLLMRVLPLKGLKKKLFKDIHAYFENNLIKFVCGGAPLPHTVYNFYKAIGLDIYEGYGLTETGPVISVNTEEFNRFGTVGKVLGPVQVKISEDGEILTKSPCVFKGYWKNDALTRESFTEDGWFKTGDFGNFKDGFVTVQGRKKSLIVLPSGKKVHPEEVEGFLGNSAFVRFACVLGIGEEIVAVVQPPDDLVKKFAGQEEELKVQMVAEFKKMCNDLTDYKRPHAYKIMLEGIPLTPSLKIKREVLKKNLEAELAMEKLNAPSLKLAKKTLAYV